MNCLQNLPAKYQVQQDPLLAHACLIRAIYATYAELEECYFADNTLLRFANDHAFGKGDTLVCTFQVVEQPKQTLVVTHAEAYPQQNPSITRKLTGQYYSAVTEQYLTEKAGLPFEELLFDWKAKYQEVMNFSLPEELYSYKRDIGVTRYPFIAAACPGEFHSVGVTEYRHATENPDYPIFITSKGSFQLGFSNLFFDTIGDIYNHIEKEIKKKRLRLLFHPK